MAFPQTAAPALNSWQVSYNGITMGPGSSYQLTNMTGLGDMPDIRSGDVNRPRDHGEFAGLNLLKGRTVELDLWLSAGSSNVQTLLETLATAIYPSVSTEIPLWVQLPNLPTLAAMSRLIKRTVAFDVNYSAAQIATPMLQFHSTDPRLYSAPSTQSITLGTPPGGLTFNVTFNAGFGGGTVASSAVCTNSGNFDTRPLLYIYGPCTIPTVTNSTAGWSVTIQNPSSGGYTVQAGDYMTIDLDTHAVLYYTAGSTVGALRRSWIVSGSTWPNTLTGVWGLNAGNNTITFTSQDSSTVAGYLTVQWSSAYLI